ncbi:hypothetical protein [Vibrio cholerae]
MRQFFLNKFFKKVLEGFYMVLNVELLDGATVEYKDVFYLLRYENGRVNITELFTGVRCPDSETEKEVMRAIVQAVSTANQ